MLLTMVTTSSQLHKVHFDNLTPLYPTKWLQTVAARVRRRLQASV
jgi:transcription termination factor Rho